MINYQIWGLLGPATWPLWLLAIGVIFLLWSDRGGRNARRGRVFAIAAFVLFALFGLTPFGSWLILPLETRLPPSAISRLPGTIVVLGGAERLAASEWRNALEVSEAGERIIEGAALAHRFPSAPLAIAGGVRLQRSTLTDVGLVVDAWKRMGVPAAQIIAIDNTPDTCANALGARHLKQPILLVTSAAHMPRSVACFRAAGIDPLRYPVDYRAIRPGRPNGDFTGNLDRTDFAIHEWIGLAYYRLKGRTAELYPAPH